MKRNEKILAGALGVVVVGYFIAWPAFRSMFIDPVTRLESDYEIAWTNFQTKQDEKFQLDLAERQLETWRRQGLPGNRFDAERLYLQWLTDLALASHLEVTVSPQRGGSTSRIYEAVRVELKGRATFDELQTFLRRFREADLLHRVVSLDMKNPTGATGDPRLNVTLVAEALNFRDAPERNRLFPQTELAQRLPAGATEMPASPDLPVRAGDRLRIGREFVTVASVDEGRLQLERGADGSRVADHAPGTIVELFRVRKPEPNEPSLAFVTIDSPFVKPRQPKFEGLSDLRLVRGETAKLSVKVADYKPSGGLPQLELLSGPEGLKFDPQTGTIEWKPSAEVPAGPHKLTLAAKVPAPETRLERTVTITLTDPNTPPKFESIPPTEVFLGETLRIPLQATDAEDGRSLTYKIEQGPEDATIDGRGEFRWTVPASFSPGETQITVSATDRGEPPLSATQTFTVKVHENLKPYVYLVSSISIGGDRQAWLWDRAAGRRITLREGQTFNAVGLEGLVKEIGNDFITYERNGEVWKLRLDRHLDQAEKIADAAVEPVSVESPEPASPEPVSAETPEPVEAERPHRLGPNENDTAPAAAS